MGISNSYECEACHRQVSASLKDTEGMKSKVLAVKCNDCKEIGDITIEQYTDWNDETVKSTPYCRKCGSEDVVKWDLKCPKCNIEMVDRGMPLLWD